MNPPDSYVETLKNFREQLTAYQNMVAMAISLLSCAGPNRFLIDEKEYYQKLDEFYKLCGIDRDSEED